MLSVPLIGNVAASSILCFVFLLVTVVDIVIYFITYRKLTQHIQDDFVYQVREETKYIHVKDHVDVLTKDLNENEKLIASVHDRLCVLEEVVKKEVVPVVDAVIIPPMQMEDNAAILKAQADKMDAVSVPGTGRSILIVDTEDVGCNDTIGTKDTIVYESTGSCKTCSCSATSGHAHSSASCCSTTATTTPKKEKPELLIAAGEPITKQTLESPSDLISIEDIKKGSSRVKSKNARVVDDFNEDDFAYGHFPYC